MDPVDEANTFDELAQFLDCGDLVPALLGFESELQLQQHQVARQLQLMADVSGWLSASGTEPSALASAALVNELQKARRAEGFAVLLSRRATPLVAYLVSLDVVPSIPVVTDSPTEVLIEEYRRYLVGERVLSTRTVVAYLKVARPFESECVHLDEGADLCQMTAEQVTNFVVAHYRVQHIGSAKAFVTRLRSLLRFLFISRAIPHQLAGSVPTPSGFSGGSLPRVLIVWNSKFDKSRELALHESTLAALGAMQHFAMQRSPRRRRRAF